MTVRPWWRDGQLVDLPGALATVGEPAGLVLYERNVAILTALRDDTPRPSIVVLRPRTGPQRQRRRSAPLDPLMLAGDPEPGLSAVTSVDATSVGR